MQEAVSSVHGDIKTIGLSRDRTCDHPLSRLDALPPELSVHAYTQAMNQY
jgi:hypothetical protein